MQRIQIEDMAMICTLYFMELVHWYNQHQHSKYYILTKDNQHKLIYELDLNNEFIIISWWQ